MSIYTMHREADLSTITDMHDLQQAMGEVLAAAKFSYY